MKKEILKELMSTLMKESKKEGFFQAKKEIQREKGESFKNPAEIIEINN